MVNVLDFSLLTLDDILYFYSLDFRPVEYFATNDLWESLDDMLSDEW